jgi:4-amino-4-deoxy-L-arabinose transferase-like glycosyltransferase
MVNPIGFLSISLVTLIVLFLSKRAPSISLILILAFLLRLLLLFVDSYIAPLPESSLDAATFERVGWNWSQDNFYTVFFRFPGEVEHGWILSWIISVLYNLFDRNILMIKSISLVFGMCSIYLSWTLLNEMWSERIAIRGTWLIAFFPTWSLYSVLPLREVYMHFLILYALIGIVRWTKNGKLVNLFKGICGLLLASLFHGALAVGLIVLIVFIFFKSLRSIVNQHILIKHYILNSIIILIIGIIVVMFLNSSIVIPYIGSFENMGLDLIINQFTNTSFGNTSYPDWIKPEGFIDLLIKTPVRVSYFLFSPFIWEVKQPIHIIGVFDGFIYLILLILILRGRKLFSKNRSALILICLLLTYTLVYSYGSGNSGTSVRHRAKLFPIIIVLAAPMIPIMRIRRPVINRKHDRTAI